MKWLKINLLPISKKMSTQNLTNKESSTSLRKKIESWTLTSRESTKTIKRSKMSTLKRLKNLRMKSSDWRKVSTKPKLTLSSKGNIKREKSKASYNAWSVKTQESRMILGIRSPLSKSNLRLRVLSVRRSEASSQRRRRLSWRKLKREIDWRMARSMSFKKKRRRSVRPKKLLSLKLGNLLKNAKKRKKTVKEESLKIKKLPT
jgi:hypothetical protein